MHIDRFLLAMENCFVTRDLTSQGENIKLDSASQALSFIKLLLFNDTLRNKQNKDFETSAAVFGATFSCNYSVTILRISQNTTVQRCMHKTNSFLEEM